MKLDHWKAGGATFDFRGHRIFYRAEGDGAPLVLLHGFPTASWDWVKLWPDLISRHRCVACDFLGFGFSDKPRQPYEITMQADLVETLLDALGVKSAHLVCHDYGDTVGQELLARAVEGGLPFHIETLHFLNGGLFPETHRAVLMQKMMLSPIGGLVARLATKATFAKNLHAIFGPGAPPSEDEIDSFWRLLQVNDGRSVMPRILDYINQRRDNRERWVSALQKTNVPTRLTAGLADPVSGAHMVERYAQIVPEPDIVRLDGVGHYPQVEAPGAVLSSILAHLSKREPGRDTE